jgi:hypothetical protein
MLLGCGVAPLPDVTRHCSGIVSKGQNVILLGHILILKDETIIMQNIGHTVTWCQIPEEQRPPSTPL